MTNKRETFPDRLFVKCINEDTKDQFFEGQPIEAAVIGEEKCGETVEIAEYRLVDVKRGIIKFVDDREPRK